MNFQYILYSRSLVKDYRWMVIPSDVDYNDLNALRRLYDLYDDHKEKRFFSEAEIPPIFCIRLSVITVLICFGLSGYKDAYGRNIYCLQGISVNNKRSREFAFVLPWILNQFDSYLNVWGAIDFQNADQVTRHNLQNIFSDLNVVSEMMYDSMVANFNAPYTPTPSQPVILPFSSDGFQQLLAWLLSPKVPLVDFAFGATPAMLQQFKSFSIVAPV